MRQSKNSENNNENFDLVTNLVSSDKGNDGSNYALSHPDQYDLDDDEIEIPAYDFAEYQKKQAAVMQRRRSSISKITPISAPSVSESRRGSISLAARRYSNTTVNPIQQDTSYRPRGSIVENIAKVSTKGLPVIITEDINEDDLEINSISFEMNEIGNQRRKSISSTTKSRMISSLSFNEKEIIEEETIPTSFESAQSQYENKQILAPRKEQLLPSIEHSTINEELKELNIKKKLAGVLPMGYFELKQLYTHVSSLTHKLRMHHDEKSLGSNNLIVNEDDLISSNSTSDANIAPSQVTDNDSPSEINRAKVQNAQFTTIETYTFPSKVSVSDLLQSHCQTKLQGILKSNILNAWLKYLKKRFFLKITCTLFWYFWHVLYKPLDQDLIANFLKKISADYVGFFIAAKLPRKDHFFAKLPDFLSFAIVRIFQDSFPQSPELLSNSFKTEICAKLCILLSGIHPSFLPSESWEKQDVIEKLVIQTRTTKSVEEAKEQKRKALMQILTSAKHLDDPVSLDEKVIDKEFVEVEKQQDSSFYGDLRKCRLISFNLYENSPVVSQYLQTTARHKKILIKRTEINKELPAENLKTYRQIIEESKRKSRVRIEEFRRTQERIQKERIISI